MAELTPMKRQYNRIKSEHADCLLFFRLGDFYELFDDDAKTASRELDLALTTRDRSIENPDERTPMCGVPYHSAEAYIARLIAKGYKVAICEQTEDPALAKGLVEREVIRIITPGTVTESSMLVDERSNYIAAVYLDGGLAAASALIHRVLLDCEREEIVEEKRRDYKTALQELVQREPNRTLVYRLSGESGPDHDKTFCFEVLLNGAVVGCGEGHSKKDAEQMAARAALEQMEK